MRMLLTRPYVFNALGLLRRDQSVFCRITLPFRSFISNDIPLGRLHDRQSSWTELRVMWRFLPRGRLRLRSEADMFLHVRETLAAYRKDRSSNIRNIMTDISIGSSFIMLNFPSNMSRCASIFLKSSISLLSRSTDEREVTLSAGFDPYLNKLSPPKELSLSTSPRPSTESPPSFSQRQPRNARVLTQERPRSVVTVFE